MRVNLYVMFIFAFFNDVVEAGELEWLCKEESSLRRENLIYSCGVGNGVTENTARIAAFDAARAEFDKVCGASADCRGKQINVDPRRTHCQGGLRANGVPGEYQCHRLIIFSIGDEYHVEFKDSTDNFKPFNYEDTKHLPKVSIGMPKAAMLAVFGAPHSVEPALSLGENLRYRYAYSGKMCEEEADCYVYMEADVVASYSRFKPIYTDALK